MFLSIIIPVYNMEKYLEQCLLSCMNQDLPPEDYELVCINDGSQDKSLTILRSFEQKYSNVVVIDQVNQGVSAARNTGVERAKGDYIWFVDSDDMIKPNCLGMLKKTANEGCDIITFSGYSFTDQLTQEEQQLLACNKLVGDMNYWGFVAVHLYKRTKILNAGLKFDSNISYGEDELFFVNVLERADVSKRIDDPLYLYRQHGNSAMNRLHLLPNRIKRLHSVIASMSILKNGLESGVYKREETIGLLKARYEVCPYLLAEVDLKTSQRYWKQAYEEDLFNKDFTDTYGFLSEKEIRSLYRKERFIDARNNLIKRIVPRALIDFLKNRR